MTPKSKIYIHHHLGLGDHIICNGLVRKLYKQHKETFLFVKENNYDNVKFMYRDLSKLKLIKGDDAYAVKYIRDNNLNKFYLRVGHENMSPLFLFDESFYAQLIIPFEERWKSFYIHRDENKEQELYHKLNKNNEKYALIHNKGSDSVDRINYDLVNDGLKKIFVEKSETIFDYIKLIENAEEIHCIDSSFIHLVNSLDLDNKKFFHKNFRLRGTDLNLKGIWNII
jgi:hypothetical protein